MILLNKDYWNNKYLTSNIGWDVEEITTPLKNILIKLIIKNLKY